jgi:hypothetical protein
MTIPRIDLRPLVLLAGFLLICLTGCGQTVPPAAPIAGPIATAPAPTARVDQPTEQAIVGLANAKATGNRVGAIAESVVITEQDKANVRSDLRPAYLVGALLIALAAFLAFEGNLAGGLRCAAGGASVIIGSIVVGWINDHRLLVLSLGVLFGFGELLWHDRTRLTGALAAIAHLHLGGTFATATSDVKMWLAKGWAAAYGLEQKAATLVLSLFHHSPTPASPPTSPAPPVPAVPTAVTTAATKP